MKYLRALLVIAASLCWLGSACSAQPSDLNLIRNSTFQKQTNKGLPDYWDLHFAAAVTFKNLFDQYGIDETADSPVAGTKVLKVVNSEKDWPYLMLWSMAFDPPLPPGEYTFSVYLRADRFGADCTVSTGGSAQPVSYRLSKEWKRYSTTFRTTGTDRNIQPALHLRSKASYYIAAPQLERGAAATPFQADTSGAASREAAIAATALADEHRLGGFLQKGLENAQPVSAVFEYDYYTDDSTARLFVASNYQRALSVRVSCRDGSGRDLNIPAALLKPGSETSLDIPLAAIPEGEFTCTLKASGGNALVATATANAQKTSPGAMEVRVNQHRRYVSINKQPFYIIGMSTTLPAPDWYFKDLADHGFNTIFYYAPLRAPGVYDFAAVRKFLDAAARCQMKVVVGLPLMGSRPYDWRLRLAAFRQLVGVFKNHPAVLGWWAYDEPNGYDAWKESDLLEVYRTVKAADPYHLVLANWCDIPKSVGKEPFGTLASTDAYSLDYYPFTFMNHTLPGFAIENLHVSQTARTKNKLSHVFIQLYAGGNAWRGPTGDELNFMAVFALMNGSMTSYYETKSNSREAWDRLAQINGDVKALSTALFFDPKAREVHGPRIQGSFIDALWQRGGTYYAIVLHMNDSSEQMTMDVSGLANDKASKVAMYIGSGPDRLVNGSIMDSFGPYEAKVYTFGSSERSRELASVQTRR